MKMTLDQALDGSTSAGKASFTVTISGKQQVEQNCTKFTIDLSVKGVGTIDRVDVK
jgi:hypothetical protein